jgi:hypothetical protein
MLAATTRQNFERYFAQIHNKNASHQTPLWEVIAQRCDARGPEGLVLAFAKDDEELGRLILEVD